MNNVLISYILLISFVCGVPSLAMEKKRRLEGDAQSEAPKDKRRLYWLPPTPEGEQSFKDWLEKMNKEGYAVKVKLPSHPGAFLTAVQCDPKFDDKPEAEAPKESARPFLKPAPVERKSARRNALLAVGATKDQKSNT